MNQTDQTQGVQRAFSHPATLALVTALLALTAAAGCNQPAAKKAPAKVSPEACADYAKRLCTEAGDTSATCESIKTSTDLMPPEACAAGLANIAFSTKKLSEKRQSCEQLVTKLCGDIGPKTETCTMVTERTKEFPPERCDEMMKHYPEVVADLKRQEEKNKPLGADKIALMTSGATTAFGPADSAVTIVEFSDFQCPYCSHAATATQALKAKYGDKIRFVFRHFPLSFHQNAHMAAEASMAANAEGKFWEFHDKMFQNQKTLDRASLEGFAQELGLNVANFKKALDDKTYAAAVDADMALGTQVAVDGTPTMFLNGKRIGNPTDVAAVSTAVEAALKAGG